MASWTGFQQGGVIRRTRSPHCLNKVSDSQNDSQDRTQGRGCDVCNPHPPAYPQMRCIVGLSIKVGESSRLADLTLWAHPQAQHGHRSKEAHDK